MTDHFDRFVEGMVPLGLVVCVVGLVTTLWVISPWALVLAVGLCALAYGIGWWME